jgi:protein-disulfide isomerase
MKRKLPFLIIVAALGITLVTAWYWKRTATRSPLNVSRNARNQDRGPVREGAKPAHVLGPADAPVLLEEFGDFQCPTCGALHATLDDLKEALGPRVVLVFRQFPLVNAHANAMSAARAAEAAGLQQKFWEMHNLLFEKQKDWSDLADPKPTFQSYASQIGLDVSKFQADLSNPAIDERITLDRERGRWIGINSTPTLFLNGREVAPESMSPDKLRRLVDAEIAANGRR